VKIIVFSDVHFGHATDPDRERDPYRAVAEIIEKTADADLFLVPGDIFDMKIPSPETLANSMETLAGLAMGEQPGIAKLLGGKEVRNHPSTRVVAIHGTHERRAKELVNPVQILEKAGLLIHLNNNGVVLEKNGEKVAIQGLSGVPDQYTEHELRTWNPRPEPGCFNIFMLHQNMTEFMPKQVEHTLDKEKLPQGFDLYLNGHIHRPEKSAVHGSPLIICGSLIPTQIVKDSTKPLGYWRIETSDKPVNITFVPLEKQRMVFVSELESPQMSEIEKEIKAEIEQAEESGSDEKPIIRISVKGELDRQKANEIQTRFGDKAIITIRHEIGEEQVKGRTIEQHRLSVNELGAKLLDENLKAAGIDPRLYSSVFELLLHGKQKESLELLEHPEKLGSYVIEKQQAEKPKPRKPIRRLDGFKPGPKKSAKPNKLKPKKTAGGLDRFLSKAGD